MSKEEVRGSEPSPPAYEKENALGYRAELMGTECMVYYEFDKAGLARAAYLIDSADDSRDVEDYNRLKTMLTKKYGEPKEDAMVLTSNVYRVPKVAPTIALEKALSADAVRLKTWWETEDTTISLACRGLKGNVQLAVMYNSRAGKRKANEAMEEKDLDLL